MGKLQKISKLRQGQEIELEFLNKFVVTVNTIIDEFESMEEINTENSKIVKELDEALSNFNENYEQKLNKIPNLNELLIKFGNLSNTFTFEDKIRPVDSPLNNKSNLSFIVVENITPYISGQASIGEKTIILELGHRTVEFEFVELSISSAEEFAEAVQQHGRLFVVSDSAYVEAPSFNPNEDAYYYKQTYQQGRTVNVNRLWFYYNGSLHNFSTDANGNSLLQIMPTIRINEQGYWVIGGETTEISAKGEQGVSGERGPIGPQGPKGDRGNTGLQGPQGIAGNSGKTSTVLICSADDQNGTNMVLNRFVDGKKYIGFKFVYQEDSQATIDSTPWHFVKVAGDTYYPHVSADGTKLYFSTTPPTETVTEGYSVKGDKGDTGATGPAPIIKFEKTDGTIIDADRTTVDGVEIFHAADFEGPQGEQGLKGDKGDKGDTGVKGSDGRSISSIVSSYDQDGNTVVTIVFSDATTDTFKVNKGQKGDQGIQGAKGDQGNSVTIESTVSNVSNLPSASLVAAGKGYIVEEDEEHQNLEGTLYVSNGTSWVYCGQVKGPQGDQGPKGDKGDKGDTGDSAGFGTPTITVTQLQEGATPTASVSSSGSNTSKVFEFAFGIPKGDTGATGPQGPQGIQGQQGPQGTSGVTPHIDSTTGNWFIGETNTGVHAQGSQGDPGTPGINGKSIHLLNNPKDTWVEKDSTASGIPGTYKVGDLGITTDWYLLEAKSTNTWESKGMFRGSDGNKIYTFSGSGAPASGNVSNPLVGDLAYNTTNKHLYKYSLSGWLDLGALTGDVGPSAGFGTPTAEIEFINDDEPTVSVSASGPNTAKVFHFEFGIPSAKTVTMETTKRGITSTILNTYDVLDAETNITQNVDLSDVRVSPTAVHHNPNQSTTYASAKFILDLTILKNLINTESATIGSLTFNRLKNFKIVSCTIKLLRSDTESGTYTEYKTLDISKIDISVTNFGTRPALNFSYAIETSNTAGYYKLSVEDLVVAIINNVKLDVKLKKSETTTYSNDYHLIFAEQSSATVTKTFNVPALVGRNVWKTGYYLANDNTANVQGIEYSNGVLTVTCSVQANTSYMLSIVFVASLLDGTSSSTVQIKTHDDDNDIHYDTPVKLFLVSKGE